MSQGGTGGWEGGRHRGWGREAQGAGEGGTGGRGGRHRAVMHLTAYGWLDGWPDGFCGSSVVLVLAELSAACGVSNMVGGVRLAETHRSAVGCAVIQHQRPECVQASNEPGHQFRYCSPCRWTSCASHKVSILIKSTFWAMAPLPTAPPLPHTHPCSSP